VTQASFGWTAERQGNIGIVTEFRPTGERIQWRVPANLVPAFIRARRQLLAHKMSTLMGATQTAPDHDFSFLDEAPDHDNRTWDVNDKRDPRNWGAEPESVQ